MLERTFAALAIVLLLVTPAAAQTGKPADIVAALYAAGFEAKPVYSKRLQALFDADDARTPDDEVGPLDFDWLTGGQDVPMLEDLKIETLAEDASAATVTASFTNYDEARLRVIRFVLEDGAWAIDDVELQEPEKTSLSAILSGI